MAPLTIFYYGPLDKPSTPTHYDFRDTAPFHPSFGQSVPETATSSYTITDHYLIHLFASFMEASRHEPFPPPFRPGDGIRGRYEQRKASPSALAELKPLVEEYAKHLSQSVPHGTAGWNSTPCPSVALQLLASGWFGRDSSSKAQRAYQDNVMNMVLCWKISKMIDGQIAAWVAYEHSVQKEIPVKPAKFTGRQSFDSIYFPDAPSPDLVQHPTFMSRNPFKRTGAIVSSAYALGTVAFTARPATPPPAYDTLDLRVDYN